MIRKTIIVLLTVVSLPSIGLAVASFWRPLVTCTGSVTNQRNVFEVTNGWLIVWSFVPTYDERMSEADQTDYGPPFPPQPVRTSELMLPGITYVAEVAPMDGGFSYGEKDSPCRVRYGPTGNRNAIRTIFLALWLIPCSVLLAVYPTIAFVCGLMCRWRRHRKGLCVKCGYNLTGNVSGVCPECGARIQKS